MITIRTFIGRKLNYVNGILRRQIELDRYLKDSEDIKLEYPYYTTPKNPLDYISKRYILYPYQCAQKSDDKHIVNHITFQYLGDLGYFIKNEHLIITCHDIFTFLEKGNLRNPFFVRYYSMNGLRRCRYIISISEFTKKELITRLRIPKEKIIVIKNGMNRELFRPLKENELRDVEPLFPYFKKLLHVGTETDRKDFLTLLKAFYLIKKKRKDIKLIRVGKPAYPDLIKRLQLENDIYYLSNISDLRLNEIYNLCDLFIYPSIYEGWGAPGLEAASSGTPVICSDIPIFREVFQDFPVYCPPKDHKNFANSILSVLKDESQMKSMREKGLNIVKNYLWEESSRKYSNLAKSVINNS